MLVNEGPNTMEISSDTEMKWYTTNDNVEIGYLDLNSTNSSPLILLHGFTGSLEVWKRNWPGLSQKFRVIVPNMCGHGISRSSKPSWGYHVSRLAMDLKNLIDHLKLPEGQITSIAGSLGCAILWSFAELFTPAAFSRMVWVDQSPLQNYEPDGSWGPDQGNRSCNSASALANLRATLRYKPDDAFKGTINSCLAYRSHPLPDDNVSAEIAADDEKFFLEISRQGDPIWLGKLMADHTSLDWRDSIRATFTTSKTHIFVIASERSGCFPESGPLSVLDLLKARIDPNTNGMPANALTIGHAIEWGGHWCYWENPEEFNSLVLAFLR